MSVQRTHDNSCDLNVQSTVSTLHIPASHTFIPFQQFSITDGSGIRNPADDNNNKTSLPVVSVVTAVSGLCPAIPVVSMQQSAQLAQAVVAPTIIPAVVTPMTVQTANCLTPTTTMTVASTLNISSHISVPIQQQQAVNIHGININPQKSGLIHSSNISSSLTNTQSTMGNKPLSSNINNSGSSPTSGNSNPTKPNNNSSKPSSTSQNVSSEQNEDLVKPVFKDGELVLEVECGQNKAILYLSKLCQGSKGPCISFQSSWLTPNEFQFVSGRETAKDWKRSIRHHGKSLKLLLAKGILNVHPTMCDCDGCRQGATLTRKGEKRRIPNGERKSRKPSSSSNNVGSSSSNVSSDGNSAGAFRSVGSATMAAQLTSPGATQAKPEVKRSAVDKPKMADTAAMSPAAEASVSSKLPIKPTSSQWPGNLNTSRDCNKLKPPNTATTPTSPVISVPTSAAASTSSKAPAQMNSSTVITTPCRAQQFPTAATISPHSTGTISQPAPNSFLVASVPPHGLPLQLTTAASAVNAFSDQQAECESAVPDVSHQQSSNVMSNKPADNHVLSNKPADNHVLSNKPADNHTSSMGYNQLESTVNNTDENSNNEPETSDLDDNVIDNESDDSLNPDEKSDFLDEESEDEQSDNFSKDSDSDGVSDGQITDADSNIDTCPSDTGDLQSSSVKWELQSASIMQCSDGKKESLMQQESTEVVKHTEVSRPDRSGEDKPELTSEPQVSPQTAVTTLPVSAFSGTCSQPLSLSVSSTNVKSEQIWVPPKLSPHSDVHHIQRTLISSNNVKSPTNIAISDYSHVKDDFGFDQKRGSDITVKLERQIQSKDLTHDAHRPDALRPDILRQENHVSGMTFSKEFQSIERHLTQNCENDRHGVRGEPSQTRTTQSGHTMINDYTGEKDEKNIREREERNRQKLKEERNRKEREERNRKEREREERKERERREEKETERRRQEEKERREMTKAQTENNHNKERSTATPTMDPSRRPPGGVAEAAAFSDYMRVLAAGHMHSFISPQMSYMPTIFPLRHQETPIATHLLHPMSAFGPQMSGLPKDPMLYQTAGGVLSSYGAQSFGPLHPFLQRPQYTSHQSLLDYQRSLTAASAYPWPTAYPYFLHDVTASTSTAVSSANAAAALTAGVKRSSTEIEAAMELNSKRMRLDARPPEYTSPWDYFTAAAVASQHQRVPTMAASLPCGLESASMDKTSEYLRKRYMEYGPQTAAYLSALPEQARPTYFCACADHRDDNIRMWSVEDVCKFLNSLDGCGVYSDHFREQRVTGRILVLLTTDHLVKNMGMKLGPAVLLSEAVAKKLQESNKMSNCDACRSFALSHPLYPMALPL